MRCKIRSLGSTCCPKASPVSIESKKTFRGWGRPASLASKERTSVPLFPLEFERRHLMRLLLSFRVLAALLAVFAPLAAPEARSQATPTERIEIDANAASHAFPHFWEKMFGSGRAI